MPQAKTGGCLCGAIRYEIAADAELIYNVVCHCVDCKKFSGSQIFCASIFPKHAFVVKSAEPKEYEDKDTDSSQPLSRFFCDNCGSLLYALTPLAENIVSGFSGGIDHMERWWTPNKEQYVVSESQWLRDFELQHKDGVSGRSQRRPLEDGQKFE